MAFTRHATFAVFFAAALLAQVFSIDDGALQTTTTNGRVKAATTTQAQQQTTTKSSSSGGGDCLSGTCIFIPILDLEICIFNLPGGTKGDGGLLSEILS